MLPDKEVELFWHKIADSIDRILACLDGLDETDLNWRPLENANSLFVLATHVIGNIEENIATILHQSVDRQREKEFSAWGTSGEPVLQRWRELQEHISSRLAELTSKDLDREYAHPRQGTISGREILLVAARHAAEHAGQAELTRDLLFSLRGRKFPERKY
jgi:hypothetical protein